MPPTDKHLFTTAQDLVTDSLEGLCAVNPAISLDKKHRVVYVRDHSKDQVSLISGGGSGHEPAHAGFVGDGLLTAAVAGSVFASPNVAQIRRGIELVNTPKGTLIVVKNYTGDVLHFGLAGEQHKSKSTAKGGGDVRVLVVGDDVAVGRTQGGIVGRRGLAGTVLVYKIAAALAREGASLDEVEAVAKIVAENIATFGVGLEHCHVPGTETSESHLAADELELGMGIHNEPGFLRLRPYPPLNSLVAQLLETLTSTTDTERSFLPFKGDGSDEVVLLVNNLGAVSELEMGAVARESINWLKEHGFVVKRILSGTYMTSLNMPGFSLTLLLLPRPDSQTTPAKEILRLLDAPVSAPGWKWHATTAPHASIDASSGEDPAPLSAGDLPPLAPEDPAAFVQAIERAAHALIKAEPEITRQDVIAGDGDAGLTLKSGAQGILKAIETGRLNGKNVIEAILLIAEIVDEDMGGTSGALYSIFFSGIASSLQLSAQGTNASKQITPAVWATSVKDALDVLYKYTRARPPSRTLVDPLSAFVESFSSSKDLAQGVQAAHEAADKTRHLAAKAGRGAYVDQERLKESDVPDPGAWGVWTILNALAGGK